MSFSVIIPSRNIGNLIPCVEAVRKHEPGVHIIVVDDSDMQPSEIAKFCACANCDWELGTKPFVFARAINEGIRSALTPQCSSHGHQWNVIPDGVVLLNDDALLETPGGFSLLATCCQKYRDIGVIGAVTNVTGQPLQQPKGIGLRALDHIAFVAVYIPRRTVERIGYMDERYCLDYGVDDLDYCTAVTRAGLKVCVHDGCFVDHGKLRSEFRGDPKTPRPFTQNYALYKAKWGIA